MGRATHTRGALGTRRACQPPAARAPQRARTRMLTPPAGLRPSHVVRRAPCDPLHTHAHANPPSARTPQGADFDRTGGLMSGALARIDGLVRGPGRSNHMCYLVLFMVAVFLLLWRMMK
jgi:hypothetical protein